MNRKQFLQLGIGGVGVAALPRALAQTAPPLPESLEPQIDISSRLADRIFTSYVASSSEKCTVFGEVEGKNTFRRLFSKCISNRNRVENSPLDEQKCIYLPWIKVHGKNESEMIYTEDDFVIMLLDANTISMHDCYQSQIVSQVAKADTVFKSNYPELYEIAPIIVTNVSLFGLLKEASKKWINRPKMQVYVSKLVAYNTFYFLPFGADTGVCTVHSISSTEENVSIGVFNEVLKYNVIKEYN